MSTKENTYKLSLSGDNITIKDLAISEEVALRIITLVMGGSVCTSVETQAKAIYGSISGLHDTTGEHPTPKAFIAHKKPLSEIERLTCLAYYLTNYRDMPAFKTRDLTKLNTEAAQSAFSNATAFARNADAAGYLAKAGGGSKQITTKGEAVVDALPDRAKVKVALEENAFGRKRRVKRVGKGTKNYGKE